MVKPERASGPAGAGTRYLSPKAVLTAIFGPPKRHTPLPPPRLITPELDAIVAPPREVAHQLHLAGVRQVDPEVEDAPV